MELTNSSNTLILSVRMLLNLSDKFYANLVSKTI